MEHYFELPITHNREILNLKGRLVTFAYTYKFYIVVDGQELIFEKDDEGGFRVVTDNASNKPVDTGLLSEIITVLKGLSKDKIFS